MVNIFTLPPCPSQSLPPIDRSSAQTATTEFVQVREHKMAFRTINTLNPKFENRPPLVMIMHFRGNMDLWDPLLIHNLAQYRRVYLVDMPGTGCSTGTLATIMEDWAQYIEDFLGALQLTDIDLLGFSMGGLAIQYLQLIAPFRIRRLIIAGGRTSRHPGTIDGDEGLVNKLTYSTSERHLEFAWKQALFSGSVLSEIYAAQAWSRLQERRVIHGTCHLRLADLPPSAPPLPFVGGDCTLHLKGAPKTHPHQLLHEFTAPVLVACGDEDRLIPTVNSIELADVLPNAHLIIFPNCGHGFMFQHAENFAKVVDVFLEADHGEIRKKLNRARIGLYSA